MDDFKLDKDGFFNIHSVGKSSSFFTDNISFPDESRLSKAFRAQLKQKYPFTELKSGTIPELIQYPQQISVIAETIADEINKEYDQQMFRVYNQICEELHIDPDIVMKQTKELKRLQQRLNEYEDKLQNAKYIELPCKIGDKVYWHNGIGNISVCHCREFSICPDGIRIDIGFAQPFINNPNLFFSAIAAEAAAERARGILNG